jgi:hypothetical protein
VRSAEVLRVRRCRAPIGWRGTLSTAGWLASAGPSCSDACRTGFLGRHASGLEGRGRRACAAVFGSAPLTVGLHSMQMPWSRVSAPSIWWTFLCLGRVNAEAGGMG